MTHGHTSTQNCVKSWAFQGEKSLSDEEGFQRIQLRETGESRPLPLANALSHWHPSDTDADYISFIFPPFFFFLVWKISNICMSVKIFRYYPNRQSRKKRFSCLLHFADVMTLNSLVCVLLCLSVWTLTIFIIIFYNIFLLLFLLADYNYVFPKVTHSPYGKYPEALKKEKKHVSPTFFFQLFHLCEISSRIIKWLCGL